MDRGVRRWLSNYWPVVVTLAAVVLSTVVTGPVLFQEWLYWVGKLLQVMVVVAIFLFCRRIKR